MKIFPDPRPYWHVDAKWICGILLIFTLSAALLLLALSKLTDEHRGPTVGALIIGMGFIRGDSIDVDEARRELAKQGGVIRPIPNIPSITITEEDLKLSPDQIAIKVFRPITDSIYHNGLEATATRFAQTSEQKEDFINDAAIFQIFTKDTHRSINKLFKILAFISAIFSLGVIYFSDRWGRLSNLGMLLLLVSLPGTLLGLMLRNPPSGSEGPFSDLRPELASQIGQAVSGAYLKITWFGVILLVAALIGRSYMALTTRNKNKPIKS